MTQEDKIREMSQKKLLSQEQKKVLFKIFSGKIESVKSSLIGKQQEEKREFKQGLLNDKKKIAEIKKLIARKNKLEQEIGGIEKRISDEGYHLDYHDTIEVSDYCDKVRNFEAGQCKVISKVDELKTKLLADIYGLPMTYAEMNDYIEKEIAKIERLA